MKSHIRNVAAGGILVPLALALATLIANEAQTLLGLDLDRVALSIYLVPFLAGASAAMVALLRLEATKIGGELGNVLGDLVSEMFGPPPPGATPPPTPVQVEPKAVTPPPPPPPPPPAP